MHTSKIVNYTISLRYESFEICLQPRMYIYIYMAIHTTRWNPYAVSDIFFRSKIAPHYIASLLSDVIAWFFTTVRSI